MPVVQSEAITEYWLKHYCSGHCTLCGNCGIIDTRGVKTPTGLDVGRLNYCLCPNGQVLRRHTCVLEGRK
jgi:hypothetical protein